MDTEHDNGNRRRCQVASEFPPKTSERKKQRQRILDLLIAARGAWVPLPSILVLGVAQYNARVYELRALGFRIENKIERDADRQVHSWFRLARGCEQTQEQSDSGYVKRTREIELKVAPLFAGTPAEHDGVPILLLSGPLYGLSAGREVCQ